MLTLPRELGLARAAYSVNVERIAVLAETLQVQRVNHLRHLWGLHLGHLAAHGAHLVAVAVVVVASLIACGSLKTVPD